jgi:hypothetical protein
MMSNIKIALIAEDDTDCDAIRKIVHRVLGEDVTTKKWASTALPGVMRYTISGQDARTTRVS